MITLRSCLVLIVCLGIAVDALAQSQEVPQAAMARQAINAAQLDSVGSGNVKSDDNLARYLIAKFGRQVVISQVLPVEFLNELGLSKTDINSQPRWLVEEDLENKRKISSIRPLTDTRLTIKTWKFETQPNLALWLESDIKSEDLDNISREVLATKHFYWPVIASNDFRQSLDITNPAPSIEFVGNLSKLLVITSLQEKSPLSDSQRMDRLNATSHMSNLLSNASFSIGNGCAEFTHSIAHAGIRELILSSNDKLILDESFFKPPLRTARSKLSDHRNSVLHSMYSMTADFKDRTGKELDFPHGQQIVDECFGEAENIFELSTANNSKSIAKSSKLNEKLDDLLKKALDRSDTTDKFFGGGDIAKAWIRRWAVIQTVNSLKFVFPFDPAFDRSREGRIAITRALYDLRNYSIEHGHYPAANSPEEKRIRNSGHRDLKIDYGVDKITITFPNNLPSGVSSEAAGLTNIIPLGK